VAKNEPKQQQQKGSHPGRLIRIDQIDGGNHRGLAQFSVICSPTARVTLSRAGLQHCALAFCVIANLLTLDVGAKAAKDAAEPKVAETLHAVLGRCRTAECKYLAVCEVDTPTTACACSWKLLKEVFDAAELTIYSELLVSGVTGDLERTQQLFRQLGPRRNSFKARGDLALARVKEKCATR
jgi:hypothetical protein